MANMMILTVTPNSALDKVLFIQKWVPGGTMRTEKTVTSVGGKGLDSSVVLRHLGVETVGLTFVAGRTGYELIHLLEKYGIIPEVVWVGGKTRVAYVVSEAQHERHSHLITGKLNINPTQVEEFLQRFRHRVREAAWVICAGSLPLNLPVTFYRTIIEEAKQYHVPVLLDSSGKAVEEAIPACPEILKMNREEFERTFNLPCSNLEDLKQQADQVYRTYNLPSLVITCASNGILSYSQGGTFHTRAPRQKPVNAAGAGDAVSSALVWRLSQGDSWRDALKWVGATAAAVVLTEGTADCHMQDILRILPQVKIDEI